MNVSAYRPTGHHRPTGYHWPIDTGITYLQFKEQRVNMVNLDICKWSPQL